MASERRWAAETLGQRHDLATARPSLLELGAVALLLLVAVVLLQRLVGAYAAEFNDDDASHYVSGLLIYDYLVGGGLQSPIEYLKRFHSHYPLVGIGHWPPLYYVAEAAWMLLFSPGRGAMLFFSAIFTAATSLPSYAFVARRFGRLAGFFAAFAFLASPIVQKGSSALMLDVPVALLCLLAMLAYVRYLDTGLAHYSALFGLAAAAALMVKGNAACLALLPPFAVLIGRRFDLLRRPSFWLPVPIVAILTGPWYVLTYGMAEAGFRYGWGWDYVRVATAANARILLIAVGPLVLAAGIAGFLAVLAAKRARPADSGLVGAASLLAAVWVFQSVVPVAIQDRYLAPALPPLLILALYAIRLLCLWAAPHLPAAWGRLRRADTIGAAATLLLALSVLPRAADVEMKPPIGFIEAARQVWDHRIPDNPAVLLAAHGADEGTALAELAMDDPRRPSLFAIRGSRLLGGGGYNTQDYVPRFETPQEVMAAIDEYAVPLVLYRAGGGEKEWAHLRQIAEAWTLYPDRWELIYRDAHASPEILLFRIRGNDAKKADTAKLMALSGPRALAR